MDARERKLFFFDCETGGLDPDVSDMVEVAWLLTDPSGQTVFEEFSTKVLPMLPVDPAAARINGYDPDVWAREAVEQSIAMRRLVGVSKDAVFVGHNAQFDWRYVFSALRRAGLMWGGDYHIVAYVMSAWRPYPVLCAGVRWH